LPVSPLAAVDVVPANDFEPPLLPIDERRDLLAREAGWLDPNQQPCASAAKLRSGGPILPFGMRAMEIRRDPPPRTVIGDLHK